MIKKPMLAETLEDWDSIKFPVLATPKLDGYRCLIVDGKAVTRKFKPIANKHVREMLETFCPTGFDGELMAGDGFQDVQSLIGSEDGEPTFTYVVFDYVKTNASVPYDCRMADLRTARITAAPFVEILTPVMINSKEELLEFEEKCIEAGYEGAMIRTPGSPYKFGRSTVKEGWLLKLKRFADDEAEIIGFEELMHNMNLAEKDNLGHTKRSTCKAGKVPAGMLGSFQVRDVKTGVEFSVSSKDVAQAKEVWANREKYLSKVMTYKHQPAGRKPGGKPRFPIFKWFRDENDMS